MKRTTTIMAIAFLAVLSLYQIGTSQQAPAVPPVPGAPAAGGPPQGGGGGRGQQAPAPLAPVLQNYRPVTAERLKKPEDGEWLSVRRTYDGWGYSPLDQIKRGNVDQLQLKWVLLTGQNNGHEAPPMVNNGVMFVSTPGYQVMAVEAKTGRLLWTYTKDPDPGRPRAASNHPRHRSLWRQSLLCCRRRVPRCDRREDRPGSLVVSGCGLVNGYYMSLAPLVADGKVMIGVSGGENGIRGFVARLRSGEWQGNLARPTPSLLRANPEAKPGRTASSGKRVAVPYGSRETTIPKPTLRSGESAMAVRGWAINGPATTSIPRRQSPSMPRQEKSKATSSTVPNESWDWDEVSPPILVDYRRNGRTLKGLINVARNGYLYFLERSDSKIGFTEGMPYVKQNVFRSLDPKTGRPDVDPEHKPGTGKAANYCPDSPAVRTGLPLRSVRKPG